MTDQFTIIPARKTDASAIARAIVMAVGEEIAAGLAGSAERLPLVDEMFTELAERTDSQYSYKNSLVALAADGTVAGVLVSYDGARLIGLRHAFFDAAERILGMHFDDTLEPETSPDEIYLDSLAVFPGNRGHALGSRLIEAAAERHKESGKPLGLLVDPPNTRAAALYETLGFVRVGRRPFAGTEMYHMQRQVQQ